MMSAYNFHNLEPSMYDNKPSQNLVRADVFQPVDLLGAPIKREDVAPAVVSAIGAVVGACEERAQESMPEGRRVGVNDYYSGTVSKAKTLTAGYHGTVGALIGMKLPVDEDFLSAFFTSKQLDGVSAERVVRLQFDAILLRVGIPHAVTRTSTAVYARDTSSNGRRTVFATTRKAESLPARHVLKSLRDQSAATTDIVNSAGYEILAGLPSLGKRR